MYDVVMTAYNCYINVIFQSFQNAFIKMHQCVNNDTFVWERQRMSYHDLNYAAVTWLKQWWRHQQQIFTFKVSNTLVTMATGYDWFFNKIQRNFPNYKQSYSLHCWIWRSNGKICTFEVSILIVKVYVAPSNKGKQLYQRCFAIIWNGVHLGNKILWNFPKKWSINPANIHNL